LIEKYGICLYKKEKDSFKILLAKAFDSNKKWGIVKGHKEFGENVKKTAIREFFEETSIKIDEKYLEKYYEQKFIGLKIGIFLVNYDKIKNIKKFFNKCCLKKKYIDWENQEICFFDIKKLPPIKKKQVAIVAKILKDLENV